MEADYIDMVNRLQKPAASILSSLTENKIMLLQHAYGLSGELIEINIGVITSNSELLKEEIGDFIFYLQGLIEALNVNEYTIFKAINNSSPNIYLHINNTMDAIVDKIKRHIFYELTLNKADVIIAIEACLYHLKMLAESNGFTLIDAMTHNQSKLSLRYADGVYNNKSAKERTDKIT